VLYAQVPHQPVPAACDRIGLHVAPIGSSVVHPQSNGHAVGWLLGSVIRLSFWGSLAALSWSLPAHPRRV
jgi:hypothetical protein